MSLTHDHLRRIVAVAHSRDLRFVRLVGLAELDPAIAFRFADFRGVDLRGEDLQGFDLTGASLAGALIDGATRFSGLVGYPIGAVMRDRSEMPEMVLIPPGTFTMGTTVRELRAEKVSSKYRGEERPRHKVTIRRGFYLGRYPVTRGEYARFVSDAGHAGSDAWRNLRFPQDDRHPVVNVSHDDATAYGQWLSERSGKPYRLPSEAEWEYACRAGSTTARFWGDDRDSAKHYANVSDLSLAREIKAEPDLDQYLQVDDGYPYTSPVGAFRPNRFGLYDMLGNVWEWVGDVWHESYKGAPIDGSAWTTGGSDGSRVLRGGSWNDYPWNVRSGARSRNQPGNRNGEVGFRVARTL